MSIRDQFARGLIGAASFLVKSSAATPSYDAASNSVRLSGWNPGAEAITAILQGNGSTLRRRARDTARKSPYADQALGRYVSNAIGTGIRPNSQHPDPAVQTSIDDAFSRWCDEADADNVTNYFGLQALAVRSMMEGGDCFGRFRARRPEDGLYVPFQVQLLESEMVPLEESRRLANGNQVRAGVEFDAVGRRVGYHIYRNHPGDSAWAIGNNGRPVPVAAANVAHVYRPLRPGQVRGVTGLATALLTLYELDQYQDAELVRAKIASMITGFIEKKADEGGRPAFGGTKAVDSILEIMKLQPGTIPVLAPGESANLAQPPDTGAGVNDFIKQMLRRASSGSGVTYEQMTGDLSDVNYSSIRAGLLEFRREVEQFQRCFFIFQFCRPTWRRFIREAVFSGRIDAPDFKQNAHLYYDVSWTPNGFKWTDPQREVVALIKAIRSGLISRPEAIRMSGYDPKKIDEELARDRQARIDQGLILDSDPEQVSGAGVTQARAAGSELPSADDDTELEHPDDEEHRRRSA